MLDKVYVAPPNFNLSLERSVLIIVGQLISNNLYLALKLVSHLDMVFGRFIKFTHFDNQQIPDLFDVFSWLTGVRVEGLLLCQVPEYIKRQILTFKQVATDNVVNTINVF